MKIKYDKSDKKSKIKRYSIYATMAVLISFIDIILLDFISIGGLTPDLLIILCVWIALSEGQFEGLIAAFLIGLFFDVISLDVLGSNAISKTLVALIAGWFYKENKINYNLGSYKFLMIVLICSIFHNFLYFFIYIKFSEISFLQFFLKYGLALAFYTTIVAIFPMLMKIPQNRLIR